MAKIGQRNRLIDKLDNVYNRINKRMQALFKTYGPESYAYQHYESVLRANRLETVQKGSGLTQIRRTKSNMELNQFQSRAVQELLKGAETVGSLKAAAMEEISATKGADYIPTAAELIEQSKVIDYVKGNKGEISFASAQVKAGSTNDNYKRLYDRLFGRTDEPSYSELYDLIRAVKGS